ncbi:hypothetical protein [Ferrimonas sp. YFM]|uniref:hypothetical protein n=1 Tax=Ferrimonas sp. YFM TaxID=3028878 RepID=UPI0025728BF8|nr:hypothetical protein [Ferrimonas sp. YFM]
MTHKSLELQKSKIESHIRKLSSGDKVTQRDLKAVLTDDEISQMNDEWEEEKSMREHKRDLWGQLGDYADMLDKADKVNNRYLKLSANPSALTKDKTVLFNKAQSLYEKAVERLEELLSDNGNLAECLDRTVDFSPGYEPYPSAEGVPRYCDSRSEHANREEKRTIKDIRISALQRKFDEINNPVVDSNEEAINEDQVKQSANKLRSLLRRME